MVNISKRIEICLNSKKSLNQKIKELRKIRKEIRKRKIELEVRI